MRRLGVALLFLLCSFSAHAEREGGNGGGIGEKYILLAYGEMSYYLSLILADGAPELGLTPYDRSLLKRINDALVLEHLTKNQIHFESGEKRPDLFVLNGQIKIASTGDKVGDPININQDLLYRKNSSRGRYESISFSMAIAVLLHEFGHHHHIADCSYLDQLGLKIAKVIDDTRLDIKMQTGQNFIEAIYLAGSKGVDILPEHQHLVIFADEEAFEVKGIFNSDPRLCGLGYKPVKLNFINLNWSNRVIPRSEDPSLNYALLVNAEVTCAPQNYRPSTFSYLENILLKQNILLNRGSVRLPKALVLNCQAHPQDCW